MHYYQFNIADYRKDTVHLSRLEHSIYRDLIDWYYLEETPIPKETQVVIRRLRLGSESDICSLNNVLCDFFIESDDGFRHHRIDYDIAEYHAQCDKNKVNGKKGGRPKAKKTQSVPSGLPVVSQVDATANPTERQPLTTNHKPLTTKERERASRLNSDFQLPDDWLAFCQTERPDLDPQKTFDKFKDYWTAKAKDGAKLDWLATWRNWVRDERKQQGGAKKSYAEQQRDRIAEFTGKTTIQGEANVIAIGGY